MTATRSLVGAALVAGAALVVTWGLVSRSPVPEVVPPGRSERILGHVRTLWDLGERHTGGESARAALLATADAVEAILQSQAWVVSREPVSDGVASVPNLVVERTGWERPDEVVVVGAHYDTAPGTPGANANASGVAVLLELARSMVHTEPRRTLRLVAFVNGEGRHVRRASMGALVHARGARDRGERVVAMVSLDSLGFYTGVARSQTRPESIPAPFSWLLPSVGDFVAVIGDEDSGDLAGRVVDGLEAVGLNARGGGFPGYVEGVGRSDHWAFWQQGWPAVVVTDTGPYRDPEYHRPGDEPSRLDVATLARLVPGLGVTLEELLDG